MGVGKVAAYEHGIAVSTKVADDTSAFKLGAKL